MWCANWRNQGQDASENSSRRPVCWTGQGFGGDPVGRRCTKARDHQTSELATQASGHTVGSTGHLPSSTLVSGRCSCCLAVQPLAKTTSARILATNQGWHCHTLRRRQSTPSQRTCSGCCSSSACDFLCLSPKRVALHATSLSMCGVVTLKKRAVPVERVLARICGREGGRGC